MKKGCPKTFFVEEEEENGGVWEAARAELVGLLFMRIEEFVEREELEYSPELSSNSNLLKYLQKKGTHICDLHPVNPIALTLRNMGDYVTKAELNKVLTHARNEMRGQQSDNSPSPVDIQDAALLLPAEERKELMKTLMESL